MSGRQLERFAWVATCLVAAMFVAAWGGPWSVIGMAVGAFAAWGLAALRDEPLPEIMEDKVRGASISRIWWDEIQDMPIGSAIEARPDGWAITRLGGAATDQEEALL